MRLASVPFRTLVRREVERFLSVVTQTVLAPLISSALYMIIFGLSLGNRLAFHDVPYKAFLVPGLIMMGILNNSFQNTASSIMISKFEGNIVELLIAPISYLELTLGWMLGGVLRGLLVGACIWAATLIMSPRLPIHPVFALVMCALASSSFALLGMVAAVWAKRFDGISAVSTFVILPLTYLGGVFYSLDVLPPPWGTIAHANPLLYMVDGLRYGFIGVSDVSPAVSLAVGAVLAAGLFAATVGVLRSGWKLRP